MHHIDLALFDSTELETANEAVLFAKQYLEERGLEGLANHLEGLVPMTNHQIGRLVTGVLSDILPHTGRGQARDYVDLALRATQKAICARPSAQHVDA